MIKGKLLNDVLEIVAVLDVATTPEQIREIALILNRIKDEARAEAEKISK